jgi:aerobic carbon-monoxide dehydrogenase medium subunit
MKPAAFEYARPSSVAEAITLLANGGTDAKILAGGQSLVPMMNFRMVRPSLLIDINQLKELDFHRIEGGTLVIGALTRHATLLSSPVVKSACPLMSDAYQHVAHGPIRNRGTFCGSLSHADPAAEMPAVALASNATMVLRSIRGERQVPAEQFFRDLYETATAPDELLAEVRIPVAPSSQGWSFKEVSVRKGDFALVGVGVTLCISDGKVSSSAISVCGVGSKAVRIAAIEASLVGKAAGEAAFADAGNAYASTTSPQSDVNGDAEYRCDLLRTLVSRSLYEAHTRAS